MLWTAGGPSFASIPVTYRITDDHHFHLHQHAQLRFCGTRSQYETRHRITPCSPTLRPPVRRYPSYPPAVFGHITRATIIGPPGCGWRCTILRHMLIQNKIPHPSCRRLLHHGIIGRRRVKAADNTIIWGLTASTRRRNWSRDGSSSFAHTRDS